MRAWTKVWIVIAAICAGLTVYEIPDAVRIWRFSWGTMKASRYTGSGKLNIPAVVTGRLAASDPEAGDMLRYLLAYSAQNPNIEYLAALVAKYPQNEFLLSRLAEESAMFGVVDSRAALVLVDKLLKLNGQNAHYRYLRGWILLTAPNRPGREREALEQFELGHRLPQFYLPYSKYKERLDRLYEKAAILWERPMLRPFYMDLARYVFYSSRMRRRLDENTFRDLSGSAVKIGDRLVENAYDSETLLAGALLLGHGEGIRLKELDLSEAEAHQSRLRAARGLALLVLNRPPFGWDINEIFDIPWILGIPLILFLTAGTFCVGIVLGFIQARRDRGKPTVWKHGKVLVLIDAGVVSILVLLVVLALLKGRLGGILSGLLIFVAAMFTLWNTLSLSTIGELSLAHVRRPRLWTAAQCGSLWFKGVVLWTAGSLIISTTPDGAKWVQYGVVFLGWSFLCVLICVQASYRPTAVAAKPRHAVGLITYWVVVLMVVHIYGSLQARMTRMFTDPFARYRPFPQATQETYERVILGQGPDATSSGQDSRVELPGRIYCSAPEDLRALIDKRRAAGESVPEQQLQKLLRSCNRDLRPILLTELADPNAYEVLAIRAEWGDRSVKEQLERIFQERLATFHESEPEPRPGDPSSLGQLLKLAGTLARISDGPEAQERFFYLMEQVVARTRSFGTEPALGDPRYTDRVMRPFWKALGELPPAQAAALIKSYLRQTQFVDLSADRGGAITLLAGLLADGDRELAEEVVGALAELPSATEPVDAPYREAEQQRTIRLTRHRDRNAPQCLEAVFPHLTTESIPLLLEHLDSGNDQLRAFIVWRVTSLGYKWPREQLEVLRQDSFWKVRVNALFARNANDLAPALDDKNAVVRVIAQMLKSQLK